MPTTLELTITADRDEDSVHKLMEYLRQKKIAANPDYDWPEIEEYPKYADAHEELTETGETTFFEQIPRNCVDYLEWEEFRDLFKEDGWGICGDELEYAIALLRVAKHRQLRAGEKAINVEVNVEAGPIALCEFAMEYGFTVELSY